MKFIDEVRLTVMSGHGGPGASTFRREKYIPRGGPDGGNGGIGGSVIFEADEGENTLIHFRGKKVFAAPNGVKGGARQCDGAKGEDLILKVPVGTIIRDAETTAVLFDLTEHGQQAVVAQGGKGGMGNMYFQTSVNQAPEKAQPGLPGVTLDIYLELKLIADFALIGLPNAGKSTLISSISAARPKIADYPFTTLEPNLGVVKFQDKSFVVADIPGLIEGAADGKGLGTKFLRHIERTKALIHLVDISLCVDPFEAYDAYVTVRQEIEKYGQKLQDKKEIIVLTKIDACSEEEIKSFQEFFETELQKKVLPISGVAGMNIERMKTLLWSLLENL